METDVEKDIFKYCHGSYCCYEKITSPECMKKVHQLLINDIMCDDDYDNGQWFYYLAIYNLCDEIEDEDKYIIKLNNTKKYFEKAVSYGVVNAMHEYGDFCYNQNNINDAIKYYTMYFDNIMMTENMKSDDILYKFVDKQFTTMILYKLDQSKLNDEQLTKLIPYTQFLSKKLKTTIDNKIKNGEISESLIKYAGKIN